MVDKLELLDSLKILKDKVGQFQTGSALYFYIKHDAEFKSTLRVLSKVFLETKLGNCDSCYMDAAIQLCKLDLEFAKKKVECEFRLKENVLLRMDSKPISNYNLTNELAVEYIKLHPEDKQRFDILPSNIEELLAAKEVCINKSIEEEERPFKTNKKKVKK